MTAGRLSAWPCAQAAAPIEELRIGELREGQFLRDYVDRARPCVIRGLASDWQACQDFDLSWLRRQARPADEISRVMTQPLVERDNAARRRMNESRWNYLEFLEQLECGEQEFLTAYAVACDGPLSMFTSGLEFLAPLLPNSTGPRGYPRHRLYLYRNGFTDWHYHRADETITVQVSGSKDFALVGPDRESFETLMRVHGYKWLSDEPGLGSLKMTRATLHPGDAIYIPVYWWHAAEAAGLGATWALTFSSPWHVAGDLRLPAARNLLRVNLETSGLRKYVPLLLLASAWAAIHNRVTGLRWDP